MYRILENVNIFHLIISITILIILGLLLLFIRRKKTYPRILLTGCCNSGKTVLFSQLLFQKTSSTYSSMRENVGYYEKNNRTLKIVDIPGNERICKNLFDLHKVDAQGIIFMMDSESVHKEIRDVAELLYNVLTDSSVRSNCNEILIVCNKQDLYLAKGSAVIRLMLEKEMNLLRTLKIKQLDATNSEFEGKKKIPFIGSRKQDFEFSQLKPVNINVTFTESIIHGTEENLNLNGIISWLNKF